ncbi:MAG: hypothetical protein ACFBSG_09590 [Leptolyngbyaceae cyanobacterium]
MYHQNEFFTQSKFYGANERLRAYEEACQLSENGMHVCITVSERGYRLWKNLKHCSDQAVHADS